MVTSLVYSRRKMIACPEKTRPPSMTIDMSEEQQSAFLKLWDKIPPHLHDIKFGINHAEWGAVEIA